MEFWGWAPGYDKITAQWNAAHPDIKVTFKQIPSGAKGGYDQMTNAITAGKAPCLAQVTYNDIPSMLVKEALMDITPYASGDTGKYLDWTVAASSAGGKMYGVPVDTGPMALYYRADLFKKFGIAKPPRPGRSTPPTPPRSTRPTRRSPSAPRPRTPTTWPR